MPGNPNPNLCVTVKIILILGSLRTREIDEEQQDLWRKRVSSSIVSSKWGGNGAQIDQMTKTHISELNSLFVNQEMKKDVTKGNLIPDTI